jgi:hypothetical protein
LWQGLNEEASGGRRRTIDPVWFMILVGAVLLALAISGPAWRSGDRPDAAQVEWSVRSIADGDPEPFVRVHCKDGIAQIDDVPNSQFQIQHGVGEKIVPVHASDGKLHLRLRVAGDVVAEADFVRPRVGDFGLLTQTGAGGNVDPELWRVFAIQPGVKPRDARQERSVLLVDDSTFDPAGLAPRTLVILSARTKVDGITTEGMLDQKGTAPTNVAMPSFVRLERVKVVRAMDATLSPAWKVVAQIAGHPWIAERRFGQQGQSGPTVVWMASRPTGESDWATDSSFVVYFSELMGRALGTSNANIQNWVQRPAIFSDVMARPRVIGLSWPLAALAVAALVGGMALLVRRAR